MSELDTTAENSNVSFVAENRNPGDTPSEFECFYCHQDLKTSSSLRRHIKYFHKEKFLQDSSSLSNSFVSESKQSRRSDQQRRHFENIEQTFEVDEEKFLREFEEMEKQRNSYQLPVGTDDYNFNLDNEATIESKDRVKVRLVLQRMAACRKKQKTISPCLILNGVNNKIEVIPPMLDDVTDDDETWRRTMMDVDSGDIVTIFDAKPGTTFGQTLSPVKVGHESSTAAHLLQPGESVDGRNQIRLQPWQGSDRENRHDEKSEEKDKDEKLQKSSSKAGHRKQLRVQDPNVVGSSNIRQKKAPAEKMTKEVVHHVKDGAANRSGRVSELRNLRPRPRLIRD